jgi:hypothetical protein
VPAAPPVPTARSAPAASPESPGAKDVRLKSRSYIKPTSGDEAEGAEVDALAEVGTDGGGTDATPAAKGDVTVKGSKIKEN